MEIHVPDLVWSIINFFILVAILTKFLYKPLLGLLDKRKLEIEQNLEQAETAKTESIQAKEEYLKLIQNSRQEAQGIIDRAVKVGEETKDGIIKQAREESEKITKRAQDAIHFEKEQALAQLRDEVSTLVVMAAGKVIDKSIEKEDHEKMIREFIQEVGDVS